MTIANFYFVFQQTLYIAIPLLMIAIGGLFSERSGVINIGLEGIMVFGAFFGIATMFILGDSITGQTLYLLAGLVAAIAGTILSAVHAFASINMNADQTISGTAINIFAPAFTVFLARAVYHVKEIPVKGNFIIRKVPFLSEIPIIGEMFFQQAYLSTLIGLIILGITVFVIYKTKFGLRLRAAGENPHALDAAGVSVKKIRWIGVLVSGALAGLGGLYITIPVTTAFSGTANGFGFLAIAILIFGQWKPWNVFFSSIFFGFALTISNVYSSIPILFNAGIPGQIFNMIPYIATLIVLIFTSKKSSAPKALGEPYDQGKR